jgi:hypothetical protein
MEDTFQPFNRFAPFKQFKAIRRFAEFGGSVTIFGR